MRVLWIGFDHLLILRERSLSLAVIQKVLRHAANGIEIVLVEVNRLFVGGNRVLIVVLLLVGISKNAVQLGRALVLGQRIQSCDSLL